MPVAVNGNTNGAEASTTTTVLITGKLIGKPKCLEGYGVELVPSFTQELPVGLEECSLARS
jgi:hypothetical protein